MLKVYDFNCPECNENFEELVETDTRLAACPVCGSASEKVLSAPKLALFSMGSPEERAEKLKKRSFDHTQKEMKHNYNKFGFKSYKKGVDGWNLRSSKTKTKKSVSKKQKSK